MSSAPNVLIVDDSLLICEIIRDALSKDHYPIETASTGEEALDQVAISLPDLIILDRMLPGIDGTEVLRRLKQDSMTQAIPVIVITSSDSDEPLAKALEGGAIDYIGKPFSERIIRSKVAVALRTYQLQKDLKKAKEAAEEATRSKAEFLANMSHEIRTPMTAILGFTEVLLEGLEDPEQIEAAQTVKRNGEYLLDLINDILDLSKVDAGKIEIEQIACSPRQIVQDVASLMQMRAKDNRLEFAVECDESVPDRIISDPTRLQQILINLVGNAIKFTEQGGVRMVVRTVPEESDVTRIQFDVIDTGIGMNEEQVNKLFQPFMQADSSTTRKFGGTGLGLTISRRLARMLQGDVVVTSQPGEGSTFSLNIGIGDVAELSKIESSDENRSSSCSESRGISDQVQSVKSDVRLSCRVLLAEDGADNQRLISLLLRKAGAEVEVVSNGQEAVDLVTASQGGAAVSPFDIILMDIQMPVLDGYDATRQLRQKGFTLPIVALTAHAMQAELDRCLQMGCDDVATKPIDRRRLIELVARHAHKAATSDV